MIHDKDMREPLFDYLDEKLGKSRIFEEKVIGKARADLMVVLPEEVWGLEIKSDADNYSRLADQVTEYDRYFDRNLVVVGSSHASHVTEHVPDYWGILSVEFLPEEDRFDFYLLREPQKNPHRSMKRKMSLLWRPELAHIQEIHGMPALKNLSKLHVRNRILEDVPEEILQEDISNELFERDYSTIQERIDDYRVENGRKPRQKRPVKKRKYRPKFKV
ncbi:MAG: sce7726 family protein [Lachnospiraceae bacterium]|nr:sce7726 family protein [Lachnospiraceae bacterium]